MKQFSVRQLSSLAENKMLSHLSDEALEGAIAFVKERQGPGAQARFPAEPLDQTALSSVASALTSERAIRYSPNDGIN